MNLAEFSDLLPHLSGFGTSIPTKPVREGADQHYWLALPMAELVESNTPRQAIHIQYLLAWKFRNFHR